MCSQGNLFTFLSLSVLVDKMGLTQIELLRGLHEVIPEKKNVCRTMAGTEQEVYQHGFPWSMDCGLGELTSDAYSHRF